MMKVLKSMWNLLLEIIILLFSSMDSTKLHNVKLCINSLSSELMKNSSCNLSSSGRNYSHGLARNFLFGKICCIL
jgi:hypothetical protein